MGALIHIHPHANDHRRRDRGINGLVLNRFNQNTRHLAPLSVILRLHNNIIRPLDADRLIRPGSQGFRDGNAHRNGQQQSGLGQDQRKGQRVARREPSPAAATASCGLFVGDHKVWKFVAIQRIVGNTGRTTGAWLFQACHRPRVGGRHLAQSGRASDDPLV